MRFHEWTSFLRSVVSSASPPARRTARRAWPAVEAVESRVALSGFTLAQAGIVSGFNPQPDPPTRSAPLVGLASHPALPGQSAMIIAI